MTKGRKLHSGRITLIETAVMDMWDAGASRERILRELPKQFGVAPLIVENVLGYMRENRNDFAVGAKAIAAQSAALLSALKHHHPERCGA